MRESIPGVGAVRGAAGASATEFRSVAPGSGANPGAAVPLPTRTGIAFVPTGPAAIAGLPGDASAGVDGKAEGTSVARLEQEGEWEEECTEECEAGFRLNSWPGLDGEGWPGASGIGTTVTRASCCVVEPCSVGSVATVLDDMATGFPGAIDLASAFSTTSALSWGAAALRTA